MELNRGDFIAIIVSKDWAGAVGPVSSLHYFSKNETNTGVLVGAVIDCVSHPDGLWVGSDNPADSTKVLIPWTYVWLFGLAGLFKPKEGVEHFV
ncbi:MAG: hypothetical protein M3Y24_09200, partial [Acidobacteriota bacterium]|nr:hypothetical protein [Acidobacteriota bacterium]